MQVPDTIEPAVGWRIWDVVELDGALRLCSLAFWSIWLPGHETTATCRRSWIEGPGVLAPHGAPAERCTCGIYGTRTASHMLAYARGVGRRADTVHRVVGRVSLWGRVVEADAGWRASHAYPASLYVPAARRRRLLGERPALGVEQIAIRLGDYGVPVDLVDATGGRELAAVLEAREPKL